MITIDGTTWDVPCTIERTSEMTASEISGLLLDKTYFNDVIGTYMRYSVTLAFTPMRNRGLASESDYYEVYELLTDPVNAHAFTMPYNGNDLNITARVESVSDALVRLPGNVEYWQGITFEAISIAPTKTYTLDEAIDAGMPALPDVSTPSTGDTYTYNGETWEITDYEDADGTRY